MCTKRRGRGCHFLFAERSPHAHNCCVAAGFECDPVICDHHTDVCKCRLDGVCDFDVFLCPVHLMDVHCFSLLPAERGERPAGFKKDSPCPSGCYISAASKSVTSGLSTVKYFASNVWLASMGASSARALSRSPFDLRQAF